MTSTDIVDETAALLPCPFCGAKPHVYSRMDEDLATHDIVEWKCVRCPECDIEFSIPDGYDCGSAVERWNTRAAVRSSDAETAAVVERLRAHAQYLRENLPTTSEQHLPEKKARISNLEGAADLIERLSRERDTGVPAGWQLMPHILTQEMIRAVIPMYDAMIEGSEWPFTKNLYATLRSAAPQPPQTGVPEGWPRVIAALSEFASLREADYDQWEAEAARDAVCALNRIPMASLPDSLLSAAPQPPSVSDQAGETTGLREWVIRKNGYFYRANRSGYTQEITAAGLYTEAEAKAEARIEPRGISAHLASEFITTPQDREVFGELRKDVSRLSAELEEARAALTESALCLSGYPPGTVGFEVHRQVQAALSPKTDAAAPAPEAAE